MWQRIHTIALYIDVLLRIAIATVFHRWKIPLKTYTELRILIDALHEFFVVPGVQGDSEHRTQILKELLEILLQMQKQTIPID